MSSKPEPQFLQFLLTFPMFDITIIQRISRAAPADLPGPLCLDYSPHCLLTLFLLTSLHLLLVQSQASLLACILPLENGTFKGQLFFTLFSLLLLVRSGPRSLFRLSLCSYYKCYTTLEDQTIQRPLLKLNHRENTVRCIKTLQWQSARLRTAVVCYPTLGLLSHPDNGGSKFLRNSGNSQSTPHHITEDSNLTVKSEKCKAIPVTGRGGR
jgi:hypothetical protein